MVEISFTYFLFVNFIAERILLTATITTIELQFNSYLSSLPQEESETTKQFLKPNFGPPCIPSEGGGASTWLKYLLLTFYL